MWKPMEKYTIADLVGKILVNVKREGNDHIIFSASDGDKFKMYHSQDCCEQVSIDDINGDLEDLIGTPILFAEDVQSLPDFKEGPLNTYDDSYTWTFYRIGTIKGSVVIRWYGSSNGYYSESVDFVFINEKGRELSYKGQE